jgi:hypothetical protein
VALWWWFGNFFGIPLSTRKLDKRGVPAVHNGVTRRRTWAAYAWIWMESRTSQQLVEVPSNALHGSVSAVVLNICIQPTQRLGLPGTAHSRARTVVCRKWHFVG